MLLFKTFSSPVSCRLFVGAHGEECKSQVNEKRMPSLTTSKIDTCTNLTYTSLSHKLIHRWSSCDIYTARVAARRSSSCQDQAITVNATCRHVKLKESLRMPQLHEICGSGVSLNWTRLVFPQQSLDPATMSCNLREFQSMSTKDVSYCAAM
jgi:hypothetical protein